MTDEYTVAYEVLTDLFVQFFVFVLFPALVGGIIIRFMRNPLNL